MALPHIRPRKVSRAAAIMPLGHHNVGHLGRRVNRAVPFGGRLTCEENGMDRSQKADAVAELNRTFNEVGVVVVTRNLGLTVKQSTDLRNKMRAAGASYKVSKNKLAKIAAEGTDYSVIADLLTGPTALSTSTD